MLNDLSGSVDHVYGVSKTWKISKSSALLPRIMFLNSVFQSLCRMKVIVKPSDVIKVATSLRQEENFVPQSDLSKSTLLSY